jgi:hypothetical protein
MIKMLSDDVLLNIFQHYLHASPQFWHTLTHVCQKWRQIVLTSPLGLRLRLYCTYGTPVAKTLDYWPPLPLVVNYGGLLRPPSPEDEDNIMAALRDPDRVCSISCTISSSLLRKLSTISKPFLELEELNLLSQDNDNIQLTIPSTFWWGHRLRTLCLTRVAFLSLPQLLLPSQNLIDLQLDEIPNVGYFSPEAFANALCGMTQLQTLSLHFLSFPPRRSYVNLPPSPEDRIVLPALTRFEYRGTSKYLDSLVARLDALRLKDINITFFSQPTLDASQLGLFINRIEIWSPLQTCIISSEAAISLVFMQTGALPRLRLQISCERLDWQLTAISQICVHFSTFQSRVEDLDIERIGLPGMPDDVDDEQWLQLLRTFKGVTDLRVAGDLAAHILRALWLADEGHNIALPSLQNLHVPEVVSKVGPLRDSVGSFVTQRQLFGLPVEIYVRQDSGGESIPAAMWGKRVKTDTNLIDENLESAEAASHALDEILRTYPPTLDINDAAMASSLSFGDSLPASPHPFGNDECGEFIDIDDTTLDLVTGSSTNPNPESTPAEDHLHAGHAVLSPRIPNVKAEDNTSELLRPGVWKEISGGDAIFHQLPGWKWEGHMDTPDQPWLISRRRAS